MRQKSDGNSVHLMSPRLAWVMSLLVVFVLILAACGGATPATPAEDAPAAEDPAAGAEETGAEEAPAEEEAVEPTEEPAEEESADAEATAAPEEEAEAEETPASEEEGAEEGADAEATPAPEEEEADAEATPAAEEEAAAEETPAAEEEGADAEATPEAEEEAAGGATALSAEAEAGAYLVTISRGCGCHFNGDLGGYAGGGFAFEPNGDSIYPANITPHEETGIGSWAPEEIALAIRTGETPEGEQLHPIMPYRAFSHLADEDALNIAAYLLSLEPLENAVPERQVSSEPEPFAPETAPPATAPTDPVERGEYLVQLARCGDCHTPRNEDGSPNMEMHLAGSRINEDEIAWNITPHDETGIGTLSEEEIADFLRTGMLADGSQVAGTMGELIEDYFHELTEEDALAIATYLKSLPPIENDPE